jgi:ATP-binding cassette, subfamily B, bacterial
MKRLRLILEIVEKGKYKLVISIAMLFCMICLRVLEPRVIGFIIDSLLMDQPAKITDRIGQILQSILSYCQSSIEHSVWILCGIYILISLCRSSLALVYKSIQLAVSEEGLKNFRIKIFSHIQHLSLSSFATLNKGELIQRSTGDLETIKNFISNHIIEIIRLLSLFIFAFVMLCSINVQYALWSVCLSPLIFLSTYIFFVYEAKVWKKHEDEADKLTNIAQENLNGIRTIIAYHQQENEIVKFVQQNINKYNEGVKNVKLHTFFWPFADFLTLMQTTIFIIYGGVLVLQQQLTIGQLVAAYTLSGMVSFPLRQAGRVLSQMSMALVAVDRIDGILQLPLEPTDGADKIVVDSDIVYDNVSFGYSPDKLDLKNISFEVKKGEIVAIVGPSASGKSSLMKLLLRFYDPTSGDILINNQSISTIHRAALRDKVGYVMQQPVLFSMSVKENLSYANINAVDNKYEEVLDKAGFGNYATILPKGLETSIGEKGVSLSGGQKQRVALARTLIKDFDVLILDDITSALDKNTEEQVLQNVFNHRADKTCFVITHRVSTMMKGDKVLVLDKNGSVEFYGTPEDSKTQSAFVKSLCEIENNVEFENLKI